MKKEFTEAYDIAFNQLNQDQKNAVINYDGPLMVIAGPGTGKTQLLAIRIGYILKQTDTQAENILALTYTDAGAIAMRQRLLQFIGPAAYRVNIYTFHAFANKVIKENIEYFGGYRNLQSVSELEETQLLNRMIDQFDENHPLKRLSGNVYYERSRLKSLFSTMKQEGWNAEFVQKSVAEHLKEFENSDEVRYKRKYKEFNKGDINPKTLAKEVKKYDGIIAGSKEFQTYKKFLAEIERFDYNDMILWVIDAFKNNESILLDYQEKYQYFLVDEYQDTNGAQNQLLFLLASYWEQPNIFAVGDDDQSIYRFQGASMSNLIDFQTRFNPEVIVLQNNYRSTQIILDASKKVIDNNVERLVHSMDLEKNLVKSRRDKIEEIQPRIIQYHNTVHEDKAIADKIIALHESGYDLSKIAVIYRKHKNIEDLVKYLQFKKIPIQLRKQVNVLETIEIRRIINMLQYFSKETKQIHTGEELIFELLHYDFFGLRPADIGKISLHCSNYTEIEEDDRKWRNVISDRKILEGLRLSNVDKILHVSGILEELIQDKFNSTPQVFMEKLMTKTSLLTSIMKSDESTWRIQLLNTFFNFIKDESQKNPEASIEEILSLIEIMNESEISMNLVKFMYGNKGVLFTTIHSSKGLEFDQVFMIRNDRKNWKLRENLGFKFPPNIVPSSKVSDIEDDRRLFYVAMTRAKNELFITYANNDETGKEMEASEFVIELESNTDLHEKVYLDNQAILEYKMVLLQFSQGKPELLDKELINRVLQKFSLSATGLNKYLRCPQTYYFENILRIPGSRNKYNGFGNAMHAALETFFIKIKKNQDSLPSVDVLLEDYEKSIKRFRSHFTNKEYNDYIIYGKKMLSGYYDNYSKNWLSADDYELEFKIRDVAHKGVPINGTIDRIMVFPHGIEIFDYKTGSLKTAGPKMKPPLGDDDPGGDYWRQIVYYSLLIKENPYKEWKLMKSYLSFLESKDDRYVQKEFTVEEFEQDIVSEQIVQTYQGIMNHEFSGCNEETCKWCNFVKDHFTLSSIGDTDVEPEDLGDRDNEYEDISF